MGNLSGRDHIYGGAEIDGRAVVSVCKDAIGTDDSVHLGVTRDTVMLLYSCVDMPLSLFADTFTLPLTVPITCYRWYKHSDTPAATASTSVTPPATAPMSAASPTTESTSAAPPATSPVDEIASYK
jgi:hypothetical protein